jgi:hypothetical protein
MQLNLSLGSEDARKASTQSEIGRHAVETGIGCKLGSDWRGSLLRLEFRDS